MFTLLLLIFTAFIPFDNKTSFWLNFGGGFNLTTIFMFILIVGWLVRSGKEGLCRKSALNFPILTFILIMYASLWYGYFNLGYSPFGEELTLYKRFVTSLIFYFIILNSVKDKKTMWLVLKVMFFVTVLISIMSVIEYRSVETWHYKEGSRFNIAGMQPNDLALFFTQCLPVFLSFVLFKKAINSRIFYLVLISICFAALMFTYSRGAYISIIVAFLVIGIFAGMKNLLKLSLGIIIILLPISIIFGHGNILPVSVTERFQSITKKDESIETRQNVWKIAKDYIVQSPLFGYGFNAKSYLLPLDTHNMFLNILLEAGVLGLIFFLLIFLTGFKLALRVFKSSEDSFDKALSLGLMGSLVAMVVGNFFGSRFNLFASNGYFVALLGMVARLDSENRNKIKIKSFSKK